MTEREKLIKKIKAMLSMTMENGASEAEAMFALQRAREMMDEHGIDDTDLNFGGESVTEEMIVKPDHDKIRDHLATSVGFFCGCQTWKRGSSDSIVYCGLTSETLFAHWLLDMLTDFVMRETANFVRRENARRIARGSFITGCTNRIAARLRELTPKPKVGNGRDLVVAKNALIENYMASKGIKLREPFKLWRGDEEAYGKGEEAGNRAQFNRPVDGRAERKLLS